MRLVLILLSLFTVTFSIQAQQGIVKNVKTKNRAKQSTDWRDAFPVIPNFQRVVQKAHLESDGKLYFQSAIYQDLKSKSDVFDITLYRYPNINQDLSQSDWIQPIALGNYQAFKIFPTCGLEFRQYTLQVFPDKLTSVSLGLKLGNNFDLVKIAENIDFGQMLETIKTRKNIY